MTEITISSYSELKEVIVENLKDGRVLSLSFEEGGDDENGRIQMESGDGSDEDPGNR